MNYEKHWAFCNASGQVAWTNTTPDSHVPAGDGGMQVREYKLDEWPGLPCYWNGGQFISGQSPTEDLELVRARVLGQLQGAYSGALLAGFTYGDWKFQTGAASLEVINLYVQSAIAQIAKGLRVSVDFRLADNRTVSISESDWVSIGLALAQWRNELYIKWSALKATAKMADREALAAIKWDA